MKKLLEYLVGSIVQDPKSVIVEETRENGLTTFILSVHDDDIKIVIGKGGQTIKALRELVKIKALQEKLRVNIQIKEKT